MDNELQHFGVLGMKWGKRKASSSTSSSSPKPKKEKPKKLKDLTDDELKAQMNRLQLEKQVRQLRNSELHAGRSFIESTAAQTAKGAIAAASVMIVQHYVKQALNATSS